ncbi:HEAT repeat domain-containing protein [Pantoea ananatis]|uniref:HEAT repeat domain-containing protein n=1 Tax=Pantoea ananas TaxID=553 RepID=UPI00049856B1|nr:HEAT repeat domain-containing protein [Pantoea ananatis]
MQNRVLEKLMLLAIDNAPEVRSAAATGFGEANVKSSRIIDALLQLTDDNSASVRAAAAIALGKLSKT